VAYRLKFELSHYKILSVSNKEHHSPEEMKTQKHISTYSLHFSDTVQAQDGGAVTDKSSVDMFPLTWPSSGNRNNTQNTSEVKYKIKFYKAK